jgi:multidrug efflux pump subunit AcrB
MPLELLPQSQESRIVVILPNSQRSQKELSQKFDESVRNSAKAAGFRGNIDTEVKGSSAIAILDTSDKVTGFVPTFRSILKKEVERNALQESFIVREIGASDTPVMTVGVGFSTSDFEMSSYVTEEFQKELNALPAISAIDVKGKRARVVRLVPEPSAVHAGKFLLGDLIGVAAQAVNPRAKIATSSDQNLIIDRSISCPTCTSNVPFVWTEGPPLQEDIALRDGKEEVLFEVRKDHNATEIDVSTQVRELVKRASQKFSYAKFEILYDAATYVKASERNVMQDLRDGILLTCVCVLLFTGRLFTTALVSISIPLTLCIGLPLLHAFGISRNVMSLAGIALGVGVVVDSSISVMEGMNERMDSGLSPRTAASKSAHENLLPLAMTTLTALAVFVPVLFLKRTVGDLFFDLAMTIIILTSSSFVTAIFIFPSIATVFYESMPATEGGWKSRIRIAKVPELLQKGVNKKLKRLFSWKGFPLSFNLILLLAVGWSFAIIPPTEFIPKSETRDFRLRIPLKGDETSMQLRELVHALEWGLKNFNVTSRLVRMSDLDLSADFVLPLNGMSLPLLQKEMSAKIRSYSLVISPINPLDSKSSNGQDLEFYLPEETSRHARARLREFIEKRNGIAASFWSNDFLFSRGRRALESQIGFPWHVPAAGTGIFLNGRLSEIPLGIVPPSKDSQSLRMAVWDSSQQSLGTHLFLDGVSQDLSIEQLEWSSERQSSRTYLRDGKRHEKVEIAVQGRTTGEVSQEIISFAVEQGIPLIWDRKVEDNERSVDEIKLCVLAAVSIIAFILYSQNKRVFTTIIILFTFVWGPIGSIPGLKIHNETLNASALIGFILLAGTIVNNGILLMDLIGSYRKAQVPPLDACVKAVQRRAKPVIITALTTVFGMVPMVFATGEGSQMYRALSIVVVYGTLVSTPLSLIGIPCLVIVFERLSNWLELWRLKILVLFSRSAGI